MKTIYILVYIGLISLPLSLEAAQKPQDLDKLNLIFAVMEKTFTDAGFDFNQSMILVRQMGVLTKAGLDPHAILVGAGVNKAKFLATEKRANIVLGLIEAGITPPKAFDALYYARAAKQDLTDEATVLICALRAAGENPDFSLVATALEQAKVLVAAGYKPDFAFAAAKIDPDVIPATPQKTVLRKGKLGKIEVGWEVYKVGDKDKN